MRHGRGGLGGRAATREGTSGPQREFPIKVSGCEDGPLPGSLYLFLLAAFWSLSLVLSREGTADQAATSLTAAAKGAKTKPEPTGSPSEELTLLLYLEQRLPPSPWADVLPAPLPSVGPALVSMHGWPCLGPPTPLDTSQPQCQACVASCPQLHGLVCTVARCGTGWGGPCFLWRALGDAEVQPPPLLWGVAGGRGRLRLVGFGRCCDP